MDPGTGKTARDVRRFSPDGEGLLCVAGGPWPSSTRSRATSHGSTSAREMEEQGKDAAGARGEQPGGCWTPDNVPAVGRRGLAGARVERGEREQGCDVGGSARGDPELGAVGAGDDARGVGVHGGGLRALDSQGGRGAVTVTRA